MIIHIIGKYQDISLDSTNVEACCRWNRRVDSCQSCIFRNCSLVGVNKSIKIYTRNLNLQNASTLYIGTIQNLYNYYYM
jgi:hypothetical protein